LWQTGDQILSPLEITPFGIGHVSTAGLSEALVHCFQLVRTTDIIFQSFSQHESHSDKGAADINHNRVFLIELPASTSWDVGIAVPVPSEFAGDELDTEELDENYCPDDMLG
jgi:hypothetical protein